MRDTPTSDGDIILSILSAERAFNSTLS